MKEKLCYNCKYWNTHDREQSRDLEYLEICEEIKSHVHHDCDELPNTYDTKSCFYETKWDFGCIFWLEWKP